MNVIQTVCGKIDPDVLGHCQMHEHLFVSEGPATHLYPALLIDDVKRSSAELKKYRSAGGVSLVDCQPGFGAGRNAGALKAMSESSGVHIITVTGYHLPHFYSEESPILHLNESSLYDLFLDELQNGCCEDRSVLPGAVKAALGKEGCDGEALIRFRAAARAASEMRVPLIVHTEKGAGAADAIEIAKNAGIPMHRILICHVDRQANDFEPHDRIGALGAMLEYDTIGRFKYHDDPSEVRLLRHMIEAGCLDQLLLSLDTTRERLKAYGGTIGLNYLKESFLPRLREAGFTEAEIRRITVENPAKVFS